MTELELEKKLNYYSPFKFEGGAEILKFKDGYLYIDEEFYDNYVIRDSNAGLRIELKGLLPFQQNILLDFGEEEQCVLINHMGQSCMNYPDNLRHWASVKGFFILKSLKVDR
jgi:hypothetical protein